jgi:hypothetical protein
MSLVDLAKETVAIAERGTFELPSGASVDIREAVAHALRGTRLYRPGDFDGLDLPPPRDETTPWAGQGTYYLPPGFGAPHVSIAGGTCSSGGGLCSACVPPTTAYVRIVKVSAVAPWSLSATSGELTARVDPSGAPAVFVVQVEASRRVELEAAKIGGDVEALRPSVSRDPGSTDGFLVQQFTVTWFPKDRNPAAPVEVRWVPRATIYGYCPGEGECRAPEGQSVKIVGVTPK